MSLQPDQLWTAMSRFGLGSLTSSGFPGESAGLLTHYDHWQPITQATISYGYGLSVTPLQLVKAYAALGGDGTIRPVSLVALEQAGEGMRVVTQETAAAVRRMLEEVVRPGGTGTGAAVPGYRIAGKTGTSWKFAAGGYSKDKYISVFAGLAPASNPRLAMVVVIDEPSGELYYGGDVAAPVFADVMAESLRLLAIPPDSLPAIDPNSRMRAMSR
jgi:cell division protein FtsI (penicillin-binding protein 3)